MFGFELHYIAEALLGMVTCLMDYTDMDWAPFLHWIYLCKKQVILNGIKEFGERG